MPSANRRFVALIFVAFAFLLSGCISPAQAHLSDVQASADLGLPNAVDVAERKLQPSVPTVIAPAGYLKLREVPDSKCDRHKCVALTFDDGPGRYTEQLLNILAAEKVPATFYLLGSNVKSYPQVLNRMVAEGHQLGNHTTSHPSLTALSRAQITQEIDGAAKAIHEVSGVEPTTIRPPYGAHNAAVDSVLKTPIILWDVDTLDWQHRNADKTVSIAMQQARDGSIILMHDIHESSVKAVPELIKQLKAKGFTLITVDELFDGQNFEKSKAYVHRK